MLLSFVFLIDFFPWIISLRELQRRKELLSSAFLPHTCSLRSALGTFAESASLLKAEKIN